MLVPLLITVIKYLKRASQGRKGWEGAHYSFLRDAVHPGGEGTQQKAADQGTERVECWFSICILLCSLFIQLGPQILEA